MKEEEFDFEVRKVCWEKFKYLPGEINDLTELLTNVHNLLHSIQKEIKPQAGHEIHKKIGKLNLDADLIIIRLGKLKVTASEISRTAGKMVLGTKNLEWKQEELDKFHAEKNKLRNDLLELSDKTYNLALSLGEKESGD